MARSKSVEVRYLLKVQGDLKKVSSQNKALTKELRGIKKEMRQTGSASSKTSSTFKSLRKAGAQLTSILAGMYVLKEVGQWMWEATQAASALQEATTKSNVVFKEGAAAVQEFAQSAATNLGMSEVAALQSAATFGNLMTAFGLTRDASADMSTQLVALSSDLASFNDTEQDVALKALESALSGQIRPMRQFGVDLNAVRIKQEAVNLGLADASDTYIPRAIYAQAAYAIILQDTADAQGDYARTADGMANSQRTLTAEYADFQVEVGKMTMPAATLAMQDMTSQLRDLNDATSTSEKAWATFTNLGLRPGVAAATLGISEFALFAQRTSEVGDAAEATSYGTDMLGESALGLNDGITAVNRAAGEMLEKLGDLGDAVLEQENIELRHEKALWRVEDAQADYNEVLKEHPPESRAAQEAEHELKLASLDLIEVEEKLEEITGDVNTVIGEMPMPDKQKGESWYEYYKRIGEAADTAAGRIERANRATDRSAGTGTGQHLKHSGSNGPIPTTGLYPIMAGEHVLTPQQYSGHNSSVSLNVTVNAQTGASAPDIGVAVRDEISALLRSASVRKSMMGA